MRKFFLLCCFLLGTTGLNAGTAQNAIWIIGDGLGIGGMGLFMEAIRNVPLEQYPDRQSALEKFINASVTGMFFNNTQKTIVTDSACAATQMACGVLSLPEMAGVDAEGKEAVSILEKAWQSGKAIGFVTDSYVADATPAGFLAHTESRSNKYEIARQIVEGKAQVVMGGGRKYFSSKENKDLLKKAREKGWQIVENKTELNQLKSGRVLGLFAREAMNFYGEHTSFPSVPTLKEMAQKAVEILSQNEQGFVLIVEAGKIDWALHDNELGPTLWEIVSLDETLSYVWEWAKEEKNTLVYLNADHETGVPVFDYKNLDKASVLRYQKTGERLYGGNTDYVNLSYFQRILKHKRLLYYVYLDFKNLDPKQQTPQKLQEMCDQAMGEHWDLSLQEKIPSYKGLIDRMNQVQKVRWATDTHSSSMPLGFAFGPGAEEFSGVYHNTELKKKFEKVLELSVK